MQNAVFKIYLPKYDKTFLCSPNETLLAAALKQGLLLANSCRNGTCRTCLCQLQSGSVEYTVEWPGLSFDEKSEGSMLPCVAKPLSDLTLDSLILSSEL